MESLTLKQIRAVPVMIDKIMAINDSLRLDQLSVDFGITTDISNNWWLQHVKYDAGFCKQPWPMAPDLGLDSSFKDISDSGVESRKLEDFVSVKDAESNVLEPLSLRMKTV